MASSTRITDLTNGRGQVLQAFLNSLSSAGSGQTGGSYTPEQVQRLSDKLDQICGDIQDDTAQRRNEKGELVDDEGLPIVEVAEHADETRLSYLLNDPDLPPPHWAIGPREWERRHKEKERVLELLEAEEEVWLAKEEERERQLRQEELERRKEAARKEMDKLKAAKEMQKKMGKALLRNMVDAREREEKEKKMQLEEDLKSEQDKKERTLKPKKSVSFADLPPETNGDPDSKPKLVSPKDSNDTKAQKFNWDKSSSSGLRPTARDLENQPMKLNVVERFPAHTSQPPSTDGSLSVSAEGHSPNPPPGSSAFPAPASVTDDRVADSDDESEPGSPVPADSDEGDIIDSNDDDDSEDELGDGEPVLEDEFDLDLARHHREVALEYYKKRLTIGAEAHQAMTNHTHEGEHEWDQPEVPLEATLASPPPKPPISKFKAKHASAYNTTGPSTSLGASVLPVSQSGVMNRAIRTGKLAGGKLVGAPEDSEGEEDEENVKEVLEMLKRGEIVNAGPQTGSSDAAPTPANSAATEPSNKPASTVTEDQPSESSVPVAAPRPKVSQFKATLPLPARDVTSELSDTPTPTAHNERSSPKVPAVAPSIVERRPTSASSATAQSPSAPSPLKRTPAVSQAPAVVDSASYRPPVGQSMIVDSPSFAPNQVTIVDSPSFVPPSSVVESSSFRKPAIAATLGYQPPTIVDSPSFSPPRASGRPERPPTVMSSQVLERKGGTTTSEPVSTNRRVSRFMAERS